MSYTEAYDSEIPSILAIPDELITDLPMPAANYVQEAVNLKMWVVDDKEELVAAKVDWSLVESISVRAAALTEAECRWQSKRFIKADAQRKWAELSPAAYDFRDTLIHSFIYAYRKSKDVYSRVQDIAEGSGDEDMILDLNKLAVVGRDNPDPLLAIGFDLKELDRAAQMSAELQALLGEASGNIPGYSETKIIRDKAYIHLKEIVDELRACGQYLFYRDKKRYVGYTSKYLREHRQKSPAAKPPEKAETVTA